MPDAGCGVYQNDPEIVGRIFGEVLRREFWGYLEEVALCGRKEFLDAVERAVAAGLPDAGYEAAVAGAWAPTWEFSVRDGFKPYFDDCQDFIERAYQEWRS